MLSCKHDRGRVVANEYLELPDWLGVGALGDCSSIVDRNTGHSFPPTAQHAVRQGRIVAKNVAAAIRGGPKTAFSFSTLGHRGNREPNRRRQYSWRDLLRFRRLVSMANHLPQQLLRSEKKLRVTLDWTLDLLFSKDIVSFF